MGGGSSGGPRITAFDPATGLGTVVGDNAQGAFFTSAGGVCDDSDDPTCSRYLVGPQFTSAIIALPALSRAIRDRRARP